MLRYLTRSPSNASSTSLFFRLFPGSYFSRSSPATGRNIRRLSSPSAAGTGRELFLRRGLRLLSAASGDLSGQFSRLSARAVSTQTAPSSYPGNCDFICLLYKNYIFFLCWCYCLFPRLLFELRTYLNIL